MNFKDIHFTWFYIGAVAAFVFCSELVGMEEEGVFEMGQEQQRGYCGTSDFMEAQRQKNYELNK